MFSYEPKSSIVWTLNIALTRFLTTRGGGEPYSRFELPISCLKKTMALLKRCAEGSEALIQEDNPLPQRHDLMSWIMDSALREEAIEWTETSTVQAVAQLNWVWNLAVIMCYVLLAALRVWWDGGDGGKRNSDERQQNSLFLGPRNGTCFLTDWVRMMLNFE